MNILLQEAIEALKFYANQNNWVRPTNPFSNASLPSSAMLDSGHIALRALEVISRETNLEEDEVR
jgi:hypothetical protein